MDPVCWFFFVFFFHSLGARCAPWRSREMAWTTQFISIGREGWAPDPLTFQLELLWKLQMRLARFLAAMLVIDRSHVPP
jgi:hypothetical protein